MFDILSDSNDGVNGHFGNIGTEVIIDKLDQFSYNNI